MKFNEKLIELRKKEGLSQEELGYKLNVTRQTVSKWELGQTTPEMEKLVEMSKIFGISVDELINESEVETNQNPIIEDQPIVEEKSNKERNVKFIVIGILVVILILIVVNLFAGFSVFSNIFNIFNKGNEMEETIIDRFFGIFDKAIEIQQETSEGMDNNYEEKFDKVLNTITEQTEGSTEDVDNIFNQATNIINGATEEINETEKQIEINKFNGHIEMYNGTQMGGAVISCLDNIITSNKTKDKKITVKYMGIETQNEEEVRNIKRKIGTFNDYDIIFEYDANGFINEARIENL